MTEPRTHRRVVRKSKKSTVPLSKLRASDVVKTVVEHPRRLKELLGLLEEKETGERGRAAATIARLSETHPARLLHSIARLKDSVVDDSAFVRWNLVYALGKIGSLFPVRSRDFLPELVSCLDDTNRIVRAFSSKAIIQIARQKPLIVEESFQHLKKDMPPAVVRSIQSSKIKSRTTANMKNSAKRKPIKKIGINEGRIYRRHNST